VEASARPRVPELPPRRRARGCLGGRARGGGDSSRSGARGEGRTIPRGPVLPAQRGGGGDAAVARSHRGSRAPRPPLHRPLPGRPPADFRHRFGPEPGRPSPQVRPEALRARESSRWPGNVRERKNATERVLLLEVEGDEIRREHLPPEMTGASGSLTSGELP